MKRLNQNIERDIIREYSNGKSCKVVAEIFGVSATSVFNVLKRNNASLRSKGGIALLPDEEIVTAYRQGFSSIQIAEKYGVTCNTILNHLKESEIKIDNRYHNLSLDHKYFEDINTYDKAYFLGFMMTDGYVGREDNAVSLCLKSEDSAIIQTFSEKIGNKNRVYFSNRGEARICFKSEKIKGDLARHGVTPDKATRVSFPSISSEMMPHYIRGIIDGDGWVSAKSQQLGFCGNEEIVVQLRDYFACTLGTYRVKVLHTQEKLWQVTWGSRKDIQTIGQYMYADKRDCYLVRKFENFMLIPR